ncbi:hypothetical protein GCM10020367_27970 [Streptomyces sannanensis]|uniref:Peptidase S11 D-alanyl-D-alanine carboxypeptidase A N-terminal domain-containing protein n=1 Tax=Streptomyces sannanensis TaxID=285536 RepID=A0ABP6SBC3_9ACTN
MAGESPDTSEQQKSSGETTASENDPRLAVVRTASGTSDASEAAGGSGSSDADDKSASVATAVAERDADEGEVTLTDETSPDGGDEVGVDEAADAAASDGEGDACGAPRDEADADDRSGEDDGSGRPGSDNEPAGAVETADEAAVAGDAIADADDASDGDGDSGSGDDSAPSGAVKTADEAAADGEQQDADDSADEDDAEADSEDASDGEEAASDAAASADEQDSKAPVSAAKPGDESWFDRPAEPKAAEKAEKAVESDAEKTGGGSWFDRPAKASEAGKTASAKAPQTGKARGAEDTPGAEAPQGDKPGKSAAGKGDEASEAGTASAAKASSAADKADKAADRGKEVDQPTTMLKAVRPAPVDQPTTALKVVTPPGQKPDGKPAGLIEAERTRQQQLPPKPPMDLLAELTNTPPPPETLLRTSARRVKIWTPLAVLALIVFAVVQLVRPLPAPALKLTADSTFSFEGSKPSLPWPEEGQGQIVVSGLGTVGEFGEQKPVPIASVTKSMTAYVVLKDHPLKEGEDGPMIPVDALAEKEGGYDETGNESTLNTIKEGQKLSLKDALSAIMIPSANNVARLLARWDAGSEKAFVEKMNATAKELGMTNTTYTDPSGLDATTVSTAADQVKLGVKMMEIPALVDITKQPTWTDPSGKEWPNYNTVVPFDGAVGIKTGSTTKAGGNLLFASRKEVGGSTQMIVGALLGQYAKSPDDSILDIVNANSKDVLVATREVLESKTVVKKGDVVGLVDDGLGGTTPVIATKDVAAAGWPGLTVKIGLNDGGTRIPHSAAAGTVVGTLTVGEGPNATKVPVALQSDLAEPDFGAKLTRIG